MIRWLFVNGGQIIDCPVNGKCLCKSEPDKRTTFRFHFPRCSGQAELQGGKAWYNVPPLGNETILLVEDGAMVLDITRTMLEKQRYTVLAVATPEEAINLAKENGGEIDLLLTDVIMPEMNGRDLSKHILGCYPNIKRLFMSGYTADIIAHHGVLDEGVHFIQKPFSMKDLGTKLREALEG
jgi:two-component system, cell cycle sensor histidine kinase and response regulator CckA